MRFRFVISFMLFVLAAAQPSVAQDYEKGLDAYERGDYAAALAEWKPLAERGDASGQNGLGALYANGQGVPQSDEKAFDLYRLAADKGFAKAQSNLGGMYERGRGVEQSYAEAVKWYRLAAEQGDARAQASLGVMYSLGEGVLQSDAEAVKLFRAAAVQGHWAGQFSLGVAYQYGLGVPQDDVIAHMWLNLASSNGHSNAVKYRDELAAQMSPKDVAKAQALARECLKSNYTNCP